MKPLTDTEREKLLAAGEICYNELLAEIEQEQSETMEYDKERLRRAEAEAWSKLHSKEKRCMYKRYGITVICIVIAFAVIMVLGKPVVAYQGFWNHFFSKEESTSMSIVSSSSVLVPENWEGCYLPTKIPQGYSIKEAQALEFTQSILYNDVNGKYIIFSATLNDYSVHLDTEDCVIEEVQVGENAGKLISKYKDNQLMYRTICWIENEVLFDITSNDLSSEKLLSLAESVMIAE